MHRGAWVVLLFVAAMCFALMAATKAKSEEGVASFYWQGQMTANCQKGKCERFNPDAMTAAQTLAIVWWAATANARLDHLERQVNASAPQSERIIRLEAKMDAVADSIAEVKSFFKRSALP